MPLPLGAISLAIDVNKDTSKLMILCLNQDMIHTAIILWTINATLTGRDLVSYRCQQGL